MMYREWSFRKAFGGSHQDFMDQPYGVTEWLLAIENMMNGMDDG
jgi:hypothetical protein